MKYYIRRSESARVTYANTPVELDVEEFKTLESNPYTGNSPEEFLAYILSLRWDVEYGTFPEGLDFLTEQNLEKLFTGSMKEIYNSASERDESRLELGEPNEEYDDHRSFDVHMRSESN
jgi:hypothetical protein